MKVLKKNVCATIHQGIEQLRVTDSKAGLWHESLLKAYEGRPSFCKRLTVSYLCEIFGCSRQNYYQFEQRQSQHKLTESLVLELIRAEKAVLPNCGVRKIYHLIRPQLAHLGIKFGRDAVFDLMRQNGLLVPRKRSKFKTTLSKHPFRKYGNLLKNKPITKPFEALVADITYIDTLEGALYLALITDVFSRKIVGFDLSDSLELEGCKRALQMALKLLKKSIPKQAIQNQQFIHHSDHGAQYCSYKYTQILLENNFQISMGEVGNCYDNALAESINSVLKVEFQLNQRFVSKKRAEVLVNEAINLYNNKRPHGKLNFLTPQNVFSNANQPS